MFNFPAFTKTSFKSPEICSGEAGETFAAINAACDESTILQNNPSIALSSANLLLAIC